jgi:hypothetical protein
MPPKVFTDKKRPVAALVSLRKVDRESLELGTNPEFLKIIEAARKQIRAGKKLYNLPPFTAGSNFLLGHFQASLYLHCRNGKLNACEGSEMG